MFTKKALTVAALLVALLTLLMTSFKIYQNQRNAEINYLTNKLESKERELNIPLVSVQINLLDLLPDDILNLMPFIPTSITINNIRGESAHNITLVVNSSIPIYKVKKGKDLEAFSTSFANSDHKRLTINIPQLRRGTNVNLILLTHRLPKLNFTFLADKGELFDLEEEAKKRDEIIKSLRNDVGSFVYNESPFEPIPIEYYKIVVSSNQTNLNLEIELLQKKITELRNDNLFIAIFKVFTENLKQRPIWIFSFIIITAIVLLILWRIIYRYQGKRKYDEILEKIRKYNIGSGSSLADVIKLIGSPSDIVISAIDDSYLALHYFYMEEVIFKPLQLFVFFFENSKLVSIVNHNKEELIPQE